MRVAIRILIFLMIVVLIGGVFAIFDSRTHITGAGFAIRDHGFGLEYWDGWLVAYHDTGHGFGPAQAMRGWAYRDPPESAGMVRVPTITDDATGVVDLGLVSLHVGEQGPSNAAYPTDHAIRVRLWLACIGLAGLIGLALWALARRRRCSQATASVMMSDHDPEPGTTDE